MHMVYISVNTNIELFKLIFLSQFQLNKNYLIYAFKFSQTLRIQAYI